MDFYYLIESAPCRSILMLADALDIKLNRKLLSLKNGEHLTPEFLKINPQHTIPTLVDNGFALWESRAILIYLVEKYAKNDELYPKNPKQQAIVNQRLFFDMNLYTVFAAYYYPQKREGKPADPEALKKLNDQLAFLDIFLQGQAYVAGDQLTIADFALLASVSSFEAVGIELGAFDSLVSWYENCKIVVPGFLENLEGCQKWKVYFDQK